MKKVFVLMIQVLSRSEMSVSTAEEVTVLYLRFLQLAEQIVNWEFVPAFDILVRTILSSTPFSSLRDFVSMRFSFFHAILSQRESSAPFFLYAISSPWIFFFSRILLSAVPSLRDSFFTRFLREKMNLNFRK